MIESEETTEEVGLNKTRLAAAAMATFGVLAGFAAVFWAGARLAELIQAQQFTLAGFLQTMALAFAGVSLGLLLWGGAEMLRKLDCLMELLHEQPRASASETPRMPAGRPDLSVKISDELHTSLGELIKLTREVRDISMLSESERVARVEVQGRALLERLGQEIPALLQAHQWVEARRRVQQGRERFPAIREWDGLERQIEEMRRNVEEHDIEAATRQVQDLTSLGALDRAMSVVRELLDRHPNSTKVQELVRRVTIQRDKANAEQRARLMAQAQEAVHRKEWNMALRLANDMVRRFPKTPEAESLRLQLPTLTENAEIQTRQRMEIEFRELMKQHRYDAALRLAQELCERYPNSPQAEALRSQLPRLEERVAVH